MKRFLFALLVLVAPAATGAATSYPLALTLPNCCAGPDGLFAFSVAAPGRSVLVGAPGQVFGVAALFDGRTGVLLRTLYSPLPSRNFGTAVGAAGHDLLVGAPDIRTVFLFAGATGELLGAFASPDPDSGVADEFGSAVAAGRGIVVVGAPFAGDTGAAMVFDRASGALLYRLRPPAPPAGAMFGAAVAVAGEHIVVGAPALAVPGAGTVSVYSARTGAFLWTNGAPEPSRRLFGFAVALRANALLVGAPCRDGETESGRAYLLDARTGALRQRYAAPVPEVCDFFGGAVAIDAPGALIGARLTGNPDTGAAYLFTPRTGRLRATFGQGEPDTEVGWAVALHRDTVIVGAAGEDGEARVYRRAR